MNKEENSLYKIESLTDAHRAFGLPTPRHPLVSLINGPHSQVDGAGFPLTMYWAFVK